MALIKLYGEMWARNLGNINHVPRARDGGLGIYILYDGSTPVYIGRGNIRARLRQHRLSKRLGQLWDYFSWYIPCDAACTHDLEALLLRMLPVLSPIPNPPKRPISSGRQIKGQPSTWTLLLEGCRPASQLRRRELSRAKSAACGDTDIAARCKCYLPDSFRSRSSHPRSAELCEPTMLARLMSSRATRGSPFKRRAMSRSPQKRADWVRRGFGVDWCPRTASSEDSQVSAEWRGANLGHSKHPGHLHSFLLD